MSTILHLKEACRVLFEAGINTFILGGHGIGKTSAVYQMGLEIAEERGVDLSTMSDNYKKPISAKVKDPDEVILARDIKTMSSMDSRFMARDHGDRDAFKIWSVNGQALTVEELIGMPHVTDYGKLYVEAYFKAFDVALKFAENENDVEKLQKKWHMSMCQDLGLSAEDIGRVELQYLRAYGGLMPEPGHRGGGIWLVDELNRGFIEIEKGFMQLFNEGVYLDYHLPPDVWIVTTMNPPGSIYPTARELDPATLDRGAVLTVKSDKEGFLSHATKADFGETTRIFADKHDKLVNTHENEMDLDVQVSCTYRSMELNDRAWAVMNPEQVRNVGLSVTASIIGTEAAAIYYKEATERVQRPLSVDDVTNGYGWKESMDKDEERDFENWKVTKARTRLKAMVRKANVKTELINVTLGELGEWFKKLNEDLIERKSDRDNPKHTREEKGQLLNALLFLSDLPADLARKFLMDDLDGIYEMTLYWAGTYPLTRRLYRRIQEEYEKASEA